MMRPGPKGPRSSIVTITVRPVDRSLTVTRVPNGIHGLAAVKPDHGGSYHVASPLAACPPGASCGSEAGSGPDRRSPATAGGRNGSPTPRPAPPLPPTHAP